MNQTIFHFEEKSPTHSSHEIEGMKKGIERKRRKRDTVKPELLLRKLRASQLNTTYWLANRQLLLLAA